jgi:hypothetical protein
MNVVFNKIFILYYIELPYDKPLLRILTLRHAKHEPIGIEINFIRKRIPLLLPTLSSIIPHRDYFSNFRDETFERADRPSLYILCNSCNEIVMGHRNATGG